MVEDPLPATWHNTGQHQNNQIQCDRGRLKSWLQTDARRRVVALGALLIQNLRRGHYEHPIDAAEIPVGHPFDDLVIAMTSTVTPSPHPGTR